MKIGILGAGSWAIALAVLLNKKGHAVSLWEFDKTDADMLTCDREHKIKLPGVILPGNISVTNTIADLFTGADYIICAVPTQTVRATTRLLKQQVSSALIDTVKSWIIVSKGIEFTTLKLLSEVMLDELPQITQDKIVILSGPSHAEEVSKNIPTSVVAASSNHALAVDIQIQFSNETFRIYTNSDVRGVELCAGVKNVIALAAGISDGLGFGDNTKGSLITRGLVEMARLGKKMGADETTFSGLAGIGDLITTCISRHSRNRKMGELIASGIGLQEALKRMTMVAEGVETAKAVYQLSRNFNIEMPISVAVYQTLFEGKHPLEAVRGLMSRQLLPERI
jgi:glycerol-3-phosphate dehydrogenase (NAD(P)+)